MIGEHVFAAGQLPSDFKTGVRAGGAAARELSLLWFGHQAADRLRHEEPQATFEAAGSRLDKIVKAQVFLTDLNTSPAFDEVWRSYFKVPPPRTTVGTTGLLVKDALIEIDLIGVLSD